MATRTAPIGTQAIAPVAAGERGTRLRGWRRGLAGGACAGLILLALGIFAGSLPEFNAQLQTTCTGTTCAFWQVSPAQAQALMGQLGLTLGGYAAYCTALAACFAVVCSVVGGALVWRKSDDWMALLVAALLVMTGTVLVTETVEASPSPWQVPALLINKLTFVAAFLVATLFPDGRFVPRWAWLIVVGDLAVDTFHAVYVLHATPQQILYPMPAILGWSVVMVGAAAAQVYRYRHVSGPIQRVQTKWVVFGFAVGTLATSAILFPGLIFPSLSPLYLVLAAAAATACLPCVPFTIAIAVLRYHLYDIDVLINRTLVYGSLTALLAAVYFATVIALQQIPHAVIGGQTSQQPLAIVLSTLLIAALFQPLRRRIQATIDRRFYRRKYDTSKTLAAFSTALRNEVDLERLSDDLLGVVEETMQPSHVSLWLRK